MLLRLREGLISHTLIDLKLFSGTPCIIVISTYIFDRKYLEKGL